MKAALIISALLLYTTAAAVRIHFYDNGGVVVHEYYFDSESSGHRRVVCLSHSDLCYNKSLFWDEPCCGAVSPAGTDDCHSCMSAHTNQTRESASRDCIKRLASLGSAVCKVDDDVAAYTLGFLFAAQRKAIADSKA